ncbi:MAG: F0F1 ATP synthase subunit gamma [Magnetococcales bacterium]|nr:F0F1 ATP synthase subunit gamma [Magnetococcales bacterium]
MASLKALRQRIRSVTNTRQITKAMKMVAAAKLRRSQERALATRPYSMQMGRMVQSIATRVGKGSAPPLLVGHGESQKQVELVLFTADRGLCGSFNSSVIRAVRSKVAELRAAGVQVTLTCVGRKGDDVLKRQFGGSIRRVHTGMGKRLTFERAEQEIARPLLHDFEHGRFDSCFIVYNAFVSAMTQTLTWRQIIPVPEEAMAAGEEEHGHGQAAPPTYEPDEEEILAELLPRNVAVQIFQALVESDASENGARMTAMDNAVRNAGSMLRRLRITYNRTRQAAITSELMEIISGSESLKG